MEQRLFFRSAFTAALAILFNHFSLMGSLYSSGVMLGYYGLRSVITGTLRPWIP